MPQTSTVCGGISSGGHGRDAPPFVDDVVLSETWVPHQKLPFQGIYLPFSVEPMFSFGTGNSFRVSLDLHGLSMDLPSPPIKVPTPTQPLK